jgi:Zn finger protein HypA/HybF involved in hydrogenase expression
MPLASHGHSSLEMTNGRPLCPQCRAPMWNVRVQPEKTADDKRTFQCPRCEHSHINVRFPSKQVPVSPVEMSALGHKRT